MTEWTGNARGVHFSGNEKATDLSQYDFVVSEIGDMFTSNVQVAHDAGIPILLFAPSMLDKSRVDMGPDIVDWKAHAQPIVKELDKYILVNGIKRVISGIIIDCSATDNGEGKLLTSWWISQYSDWLLDVIYKKYEIPVYLYMNSSPMKSANTEGAQMINNLLYEWGICTVSRAAIKSGFPVPNSKPSLPPKVDESYVHWWFWLYGMIGETGLWLYNGDKTALYNDLSFKAADPDVIDGVVGEITDDQCDIMDLQAAVDVLFSKVEELEKTVASIAAWKNRPL